MNVFEPNLDRLLVVLDEEDLDIDTPVFQRTKQVAEALAGGAQVELFYVEAECGVAQKLFARDDELAETLARRKKAIGDRLQSLTRVLESDRVRVTSHVVHAASEVDRLLDKIRAARPDVVLKRSTDHRFVIGVASHSDWELLRSSPSHVWFVGDNRRPPKRILSAIGSLDVAGDGDVISALDYDIFALAKFVGAVLDAENHPVHVFRTPQGIAGYGAYTRVLGGMNYPARELPSISEIRRAIAHEHGRVIRAFAEYFELDPSTVRLAEGHPADVLPRIAAKIAADLIVMGARNLTRWQRATRSVTAEAVLGKVVGDVLVVKDTGERSADRHAVDVEQAIVDPEQVFGTPEAVAKAGELSVAVRHRILDAWHQDAEAMLRMEAEGGIEDDFDAGIIPEIDRVRRQLASAECK